MIMMKPYFEWMTRFGVVLFLVLALPLHGITQEEETSVTPKKDIEQSVKDQLAALLPDAKSLNAQLDGEVEFYGENLYELIDGAAGIFHDYDFVALGHAVYKRDESDITVDIYFMGKPLNAYGVFSIEGSPDYNYVDIGTSAYLEDGILNFVQGSYYVKISAYGNDAEQVKSLMKEFASSVSSQIKEGKELPELLKLLPESHLVAHSKGYNLKAPLGYQFLAPALTANYQFGEVTATLILSIAENADQAKKRIQQMREQVAKSGSVEDLAGYGEGAFRGKDKYRGDIVGLVLQGKDEVQFSVFVVKPPEGVGEFLQEIQKLLNPEEK